MKYSIIISPNSKNSSAVLHAQGFIKALLKIKYSDKNFAIDVFLYGYSVKYAFEHNEVFEKLDNNGVTISACSTIAESFLSQATIQNAYIKLSGLGHWMESTLDADKNIEFV